MKKALFILLGIGVIAGGIWAYFWVIQGWVKDYPEAARAMPEDAFLMYNGTGISTTFSSFLQTDIGQKVKQHPSFQGFESRFKRLDSLTQSWKAIRELRDQMPFQAGLINASVDELDLLFLVQTKRLRPGKLVKSTLQDWQPTLQFQSRGFREYTITEVTNAKGKHLVSYAAIEGILAVSANPLLIEEAIRTFKTRKDTTLPASVKALAKSEANEKVIVNYDQMPNFLGAFMKNRARRALKEADLLRGYGVYRLDLNDETMELSGNFKGARSVLMNHLRQIPPAQSQIPNAVPMRTALFVSFLIPEPAPYLDSLKSDLKARDRYLKFKHFRDSLENAGNFDLKEDFLPILGDELAWVMNEPVSERFEQNVFLAMHCQDIDQNLKALDELNAKIEADRQSTTEPIHYRNRLIKKANFSGIFDLLFGGVFALKNEPFYVALGDHLLFAGNQDPLKRAIDDYEAGQNLASSSHYIRLSEHLLSESNFFFYVNPERSLMLPFNYLRDSLMTDYRSQLNYYKQFGGLTFQLAAEDQGFFAQTTLQESVTDVQKTELLWKKRLDSGLAQRPQVVRNHETNEKELFMVDKQNQVSLITNSGNIRWKRPMQGPVMGDVIQIDYYRNDNWQYCFATKSQLQLIDRKGNDVANFPIGFSAPAATDLAVFDYNENKNYRYFIGKKNRGIYGYRTSGKPMDGWSPKRMADTPDHEMKHFIYQGKTYLFTVSKNGSFYLWDTQGNRIQEPKKLETHFPSEFEINFGDSKASTYLVAPDTAGKVHYLYLDGKVKKRQFGNWGPKHYFNYLDINRDDEKELIFSEGTNVQGFKADSTEAFSLTLPDSLAFEPAFYQFNGQYHIGYGTKQTDQIFLMDLDGTIKKGFPVRGNTPFIIRDINEDGEKEMVVGGKNNMLYLYRINE